MSYHLKKIKKGKIGKFSKVREEFEELKDAKLQNDKLLILCELSDLVGAIEAYAESFGVSLEDLIKFSNKTKSAFKEGKR